MPSTTVLLNRMKLQAEGWNRVGEKGLLGVLNEAQDILYMQDMAQTIAYRSDGDLPYITTTDSQRLYTLNQAVTGLSVDIWRIDSVLVKPLFSNELLAAIGNEYGIKPNLRQPVQSIEFNGIEYFRFYQVATNDAKRSSHPILRFTNGPGDTTQDYYILAYMKPVQMISEKIQPTLPEDVHYTALLPTAMKLLEGYQNGNIVEALTFIKKEYMPEVQSVMSGGDQGESHSITRYEE